MQIHISSCGGFKMENLRTWVPRNVRKHRYVQPIVVARNVKRSRSMFSPLYNWKTGFEINLPEMLSSLPSCTTTSTLLTRTSSHKHFWYNHFLLIIIPFHLNLFGSILVLICGTRGSAFLCTWFTFHELQQKHKESLELVVSEKKTKINTIVQSL